MINIKKLCFVLVVVMCISITACTAPQTATKEPQTPPQAEEKQSIMLVDTSTIKVVREGNITTIHDTTAERVHTLVTYKKLTRKKAISYGAKCIINTDTLQVSQYKGKIIIIDKVVNKMFYI